MLCNFVRIADSWHGPFGFLLQDVEDWTFCFRGWRFGWHSTLHASSAWLPGAVRTRRRFVLFHFDVCMCSLCVSPGLARCLHWDRLPFSSGGHICSACLRAGVDHGRMSNSLSKACTMTEPPRERSMAQDKELASVACK